MRAAGIIINAGNILLIHRFCNKKEYFVCPGGGVEEGESIEEAVIREIKEETSLNAVIDKKLWEIADNFDGRIHHFYLLKNIQGIIKLGGIEAERNSENNQYLLEWHKISEIKNLLIYPAEFKSSLISTFKNNETDKQF